ncbi:MAG TPA: DUF1573 domain-containing protein [Candidatus Anammoximicrobium sp.]|nr:DUF1573 domain-containing protein [Candidatus Anammoximicrobium sp.]
MIVALAGTRTLHAESDAPLGPRLVVRQEDHDFGKMETNNAGQHEFLLTNAGDQPLTLQQGKETCGCCTCVCETKLPDGGRIPPHESAAVTLKWTIKRFIGAYHQTSTILTNDPRRPEVMLAVAGRLVPAVRVVPAQFVFSSPLVGETVSGEVRVYGYRAEPLKISDCRLSDPAGAPFFETAIAPLPAEEVAQEPDARNGFLLRATLKPGLPLGPFRQDIVLATNVDSAPTVEIPIQGRIASPVSVAGPGWDSGKELLKFPPLAGQTGGQRNLLLLVRGPHCKATTFRLARVVPDCLAVELGQTKASSDGQSTRTPLVIRIPAGSPPASHLGPPQGELGQIVVETTHPQQPQLRLLVSFAVKE